jgi:hypothetical protein
MSVANLYFVPCVFLIVLSSIIILLCFVKFKSLRNIRRRRNWVIYASLILLGLLFYQAYYASLGPNEVYFSLQKPQIPVYSGHENQFSITCSCGGIRQADFYLVIRSDNATLSTKGQPGYIQVNATAIKIPFSFQRGGVQTKLVYFTADANVSSFSFYPTVERNSPIMIWVFLNEIRSTYDPATRSYQMGDSFPMGPQ